MSEELVITDEMIEVCAKAFFRDGQSDKSYPHKTWQGQFDEFKGLLDKKQLSPNFLQFVYNANKTTEFN